MEDQLLKALDQKIREVRLVGRSEAIRQAVREWLKRQEMRKKVQKEIEGYLKKPITSDEFEPFLRFQELP